ncbi:restriction endonuclease subunit S [Thermoclostridium stercorarium subsp. thermolacticum DSM 2910]|uniref:Restriction endonuclease subunit S n=3 Tax=Thermoclostridium stercorarium TaxID=1510 RepID=A0A1B1YKU7_THEST|nr:restriction endonuclease subunit S [Thermoclostridium stercorarium]ANW98869.1 restriction endonuclease subunit S [Thermoclostridium stercorarium subsp. thermolacticum DSM 2910]ANX01395.1 restriction endonuclease subunit S [Thermoclostridium stercorarium subsp. leptospartum DSM 9219]
MTENRKAVREEMNELPEGFKMTELGPIPKEWKIERLEEMVSEIMSGEWGKDENAPGLVACRVLRGTDFAEAEKCNLSKVPVRYVKAAAVQRRQLKAGDLVVELSGGSEDQPTGRILLVADELLNRNKMPVLYSNFTKRIRISSDYVLPEYFAYYWRHLYNLGATRLYEKRTTGIRNFKLDDFLRSEMITIPPVNEQKAISRILFTVQQARETTERVIQATNELKKSLMRYLFTYGPVPLEKAERVPLKEIETGSVPEHWSTVDFGAAVLNMRFHVGKVKQKEYLNSGRFPVVDQGQKLIAGYWNKPEDVYNGPLPVIIFGDHTRVFKFINFRFVCGADGTKILIPNTSKFDPAFLYYALTRLEIPNRGYNRHYALLRQQRLICPPLSEQKRIADILGAVDKKLRAEELKKQALETLFKTLLYNLMTGRISVKNINIT